MTTAIIKKNSGLQSDSTKFGSTYYVVEVNDTEWTENKIIRCNSNEDFLNQIESERICDNRFISYKIVKKETPTNFIEKRKWLIFVTIEKQMKGTRFIQANNYIHAKQIKAQYN